MRPEGQNDKGGAAAHIYPYKAILVLLKSIAGSAAGAARLALLPTARPLPRQRVVTTTGGLADCTLQACLPIEGRSCALSDDARLGQGCSVAFHRAVTPQMWAERRETCNSQQNTWVPARVYAGAAPASVQLTCELSRACRLSPLCVLLCTCSCSCLFCSPRGCLSVQGVSACTSVQVPQTGNPLPWLPVHAFLQHVLCMTSTGHI